ncbi:MAG: hypothetical protein SCH70_02260 [Candidatus Methanoperedens sp.]|nr:hypothetical protein [Candidatus Methanoperedens sp.]
MIQNKKAVLYLMSGAIMLAFLASDFSSILIFAVLAAGPIIGLIL